MSETVSAFSVNDVTKVFHLGGALSKTSIVAVNSARFEIGRGGKPEIFTLAGESGSGKTTLAKLALGMEEPSSGTILQGDRDLIELAARRDRLAFMNRVQPIFQNPFETFSPLKPVRTYLFETARNFGVGKSHAERTQVIEDCLHLVGLSLEALGGKYPNEFSGGQLQRTAIARALIPSPAILVADEPVSMVDASIRMSIVNLFRRLCDERGVNVLYITHDLATAYYASDRIAIMLRGNIVEMGSVEDVLDSPKHPYTKLLLESIPNPDPDQRWQEEIELATFEEKEFAQKGCKFAGRCPFVMDICRSVDPEARFTENRHVKCFLYEDESGSSGNGQANR